MSRFLLTLAAVVAAGAMYAVAASGSQQAGPTAKQFSALKKDVAKLQKQVKLINQQVGLLAFVDFQCMLHATVGVAQRGDPGGTWGYSFTPNGGSPAPTTALDLSDTPTSTLLTLNPDPNAQCADIVGTGLGANHRFPVALLRWAKLHH